MSRISRPRRWRSSKNQSTPQTLTDRYYPRQRGEESQQVRDLYSGTGIENGRIVIAPPINLDAMVRLPSENSTLGSCIDAMVTNIEGHGGDLVYTGPEDGEESSLAQAEHSLAQGFIDRANDRESLVEVLGKRRRDKETVGNSYLEIMRDRTGAVYAVEHVPAQTLSITRQDEEPVHVEMEALRNGKVVRLSVKRRFRRFVQIQGGKRVYFKEYGDPRIIDPESGDENQELPPEKQATEIIHECFYNPKSPYGVPRWLPQLPSVLGSRQAEMTNLDFFSSNAIPAMALMVSGGMVTTESLQDLEEHFVAARGRQSMHRIVIIEAEGNPDAASPTGQIPTPKIELKGLQQERQGDALFLAYDERCSDKIRSAFRLPPIHLGLSSDYNYNTSKTAFEVAETQVFSPERRKTDEVVTDLLRAMGVRMWSYRSRPPRLSDPEDVIKAAKAFNDLGAITPNIAIQLANDYFDMEIEPIAEPWGDFPFSLTSKLTTSGRVKGLEGLADPPEPQTETVGSVPLQTSAKPGQSKPATPDEKKAAKMEAVRLALSSLRQAVNGE